MIVRWFISPLVYTVVLENGVYHKRFVAKVGKPYKLSKTFLNSKTQGYETVQDDFSKYPYLDWAAVPSKDNTVCLVRWTTNINFTVNPDDIIKELKTEQDWESLYLQYPEFRGRWGDQFYRSTL